MKKFLSCLLLTLLVLCFVSCDSNDVSGKYDGEAAFSVYSDDGLVELHNGKYDVGERYYLLIDVQIEKNSGVFGNENGAELSVEHLNTEKVLVTYNSGVHVTTSENSDTITYSCNLTEGNYKLVFEVVFLESNASFDINVLIDGKIINSKTISL